MTERGSANPRVAHLLNWLDPSSVEQVGVGRCAEIFAVSDDLVLKLYEPQFGSAMVERFARVGNAVHLAGVPSPEIHAVDSRGDRNGIVLERIHGVTLWEAIVRSPPRAEEFGAQLAELHIEVHRTAVDGLRAKLDEMRRRVEARRPHNAFVDEALSVIDRGHGLPQVLVHGDLHPANVMVDERDDSLISIDWDGAKIGPAAADVVRTEYLVSSWALAPGTSSIEEPLRRRVAGAFVERYDELADASVGALKDWRMPIVLSRYGEVDEESTLLESQIAALR